MLPGIKWVDDFLQKKEGAKKINFGEICGSYQMRDKVDTNKNLYYGIGCDCKDSIGLKCNHIG